MKILAIEDDPSVLAILRSGFAEDGHEVVACTTGEEGLDEAESADVDLLIVDIGLPGMSGLELVRHLRDSGDVRPVIFLTAERDEDDIVRGLELGADGYVPKPFSMNELRARVKALVRALERRPVRRLAFGDLEIDALNRTATRDGKTVCLTNVELKLLVALFSGKGEPVSRKSLLEKVWGIRFDPRTANLDVHLYKLRRKLQASGPPLIENVRGVGWRITPSPD